MTLAESADTLDMAQTLDDSANRAVQDIAAITDAASITDGIARWDDVRSIQSGLATYSGQGNFSVVGGGSGIMDLDLEVDFGARTYGGSNSQLSLISGLEATTYISQNSFSSLDGSAVITLLSPVNSTNSYFDNTTFTFENQGGVAAKDVVVNLVFSNPQQGSPASGEMTVPRTP